MKNPLLEGVDITSYLAEFVEENRYLFFALVSRGWRTAWGRRPTVTKALTTDSSVSQLLYSFECGLGRSAAMCDTAARLGRLDLLQIARARGCPFGLRTSANAAEEGHLELLKFYEETAALGTGPLTRPRRGEDTEIFWNGCALTGLLRISLWVRANLTYLPLDQSTGPLRGEEALPA